MTERHTGAQAAEARESDVSFPWIVLVLLRSRRVILLFAGIGLVLSVAVAMLRPIYYTSTFSFVPQSGQDQGRSGLASIAGQFGIALGSLGGQSQPPQLYADLLRTREILGQIARDSVALTGRGRVPVAAFFGIEEVGPVALESTMRMLREKVIATSVAARTTGMVTVTVRTRSPEASQQIAQAALDGLNQFNLATRKSQAGEERRFTEARLQAAKASLQVAENAVQSLLQGNRQMSGFSEASFRRERLQREVTLQQQIVTGLAQQYEDARIREVRDTPVITVIEKPALPVIPDPRGRGLTMVMGLIGSLVIAVVLVLVRAGWARQREQDHSDESYGALTREWTRTRDRSLGA